MPRPKSTIPTDYFNVGLPQDVAAQVRQHLHSDLEGRIPHGALSKFFTQLATEFFRTQQVHDAAN